MVSLRLAFVQCKMVRLNLIILLGLCVAGCLGGVVPEDCADSSKECYDNRLHPDSKVHNRNVVDVGEEVNSKYWMDEAMKFVTEQSKLKPNTKVAKNVIFFIGDGMSIPTLASARVYIGGEEKHLSFEKFPYTGMSKTYCLDRKVPDSASTATSYLTGVKGNYGTIGVNGQVARGDCVAATNSEFHTHSIAKWAQDAGKDTGIVTTTRVTHASPSGNYAHVAERNWESDSNLPTACRAGFDIASQLVHGDVGSKLKVILGGGRREFRNSTFTDEEGENGARLDGKDLIQEWLSKDPLRKYVYNRNDLSKVDVKTIDSLLGLFQNTHMLYHLEAENNLKVDEKPTLEDMTRKAIEILSKNKDGFYLFVEGGKIDLAHHDVFAKIALDETAELSKAVQAAVDMTNAEETLIVVSSDHAHTMSYAGYPDRKNDIFGTAEISNEDELPYMTLSYANGKAYEQYLDTKTNSRKHPVSSDNDAYDMMFPSTLPLNSETHGGEDVAVFARGPWAHLFSGVYEQNVLPHLMAYASCIGDGLKACD